MKATETKVQVFFSYARTQFVIPVYQRNYDWTLKQCSQLLDDIIEVGSNSTLKAHFIGSIVHIHDDAYTVSRITELVIIDGQQRLTTITLMFLALYHLAIELNDTSLASELEDTYLINRHASGSEKLKLRPTENNDKALKFILRNEKGEIYPEYSNLIMNFNFFASKINKNNYEVVLRGISKLMFVEIALDRVNDNPQRIFESLNSTGLDLSASDLIRNYILMELPPNEQIRIYKNYWELIESFAKDEENNKSKVTDFIKSYLTIKNNNIPKIEKIYIEFKKIYSYSTIDNLENLLKDMKSLVKYYNKLINPSKEEDKKIKTELNYVKRLGIDVVYPFLMKVYEDYGNDLIDKIIFIEILRIVQSFIWRRFIIGLPSNALPNIFTNLYDKIDKNNYLISIQKALLQRTGSYRFPKDNEIKKVLKEKDMYNIQPKNRLYFLDRLENHNNKEQVILDNNITVEHIFPQNPEAKWKTVLSDDDYRKMKDIYINTISNLTLSGNNQALSNKYFEYKKNTEIIGYKDSRLWLNKYLANLEKWDMEELSKRFDILYKRFLEIWVLPNVTINENTEEGEINIFEAEDPTNKQIEYAIIFGEKIFIQRQQVARFYQEVMKILFEVKSNLFFETDLKIKLNLTEKGYESKLRQPCQISENYFIESNNSNSDKFEKIKNTLTLLDFEDEVFIKYTSSSPTQLPLMQ